MSRTIIDVHTFQNAYDGLLRAEHFEQLERSSWGCRSVFHWIWCGVLSIPLLGTAFACLEVIIMKALAFFQSCCRSNDVAFEEVDEPEIEEPIENLPQPDVVLPSVPPQKFRQYTEEVFPVGFPTQVNRLIAGYLFSERSASLVYRPSDSVKLPRDYGIVPGDELSVIESAEMSDDGTIVYRTKANGTMSLQEFQEIIRRRICYVLASGIKSVSLHYPSCVYLPYLKELNEHAPEISIRSIYLCFPEPNELDEFRMRLGRRKVEEMRIDLSFKYDQDMRKAEAFALLLLEMQVSHLYLHIDRTYVCAVQDIVEFINRRGPDPQVSLHLDHSSPSVIKYLPTAKLTEFVLDIYGLSRNELDELTPFENLDRLSITLTHNFVDYNSLLVLTKPKKLTINVGSLLGRESDQALVFLSMPNLDQSDIEGNIRDEDFLDLSPNPNLQQLTLDGGTLTDEGLARLPALFPNLELIILKRLPITDEGLNALLSLKNGGFVHIEKCPNITPMGEMIISSKMSLKLLDSLKFDSDDDEKE